MPFLRDMTEEQAKAILDGWLKHLPAEQQELITDSSVWIKHTPRGAVWAFKVKVSSDAAPWEEPLFISGIQVHV